jgi:hypothetical protein
MKTYKEFIAEAAPQRLKRVILYHGTSPEAAKKIEKSGFNSPEVYASTNRETAQSFGSRHGKGVKTLSFNVPKKSIKKEAPGKVVKTDGQRGVNAWGKEEYSVAMDRDYARKHMSKNSDGVIHAPKVPVKYRHLSPFKQRTKIRPKKK